MTIKEQDRLYIGTVVIMLCVVLIGSWWVSQPSQTAAMLAIINATCAKPQCACL